MTVVVARYNEDISWTKRLSPDINVVIVQKDEKNIGRESYSYFQFIIENYPNLSGQYVFCQGNPIRHCKDFIAKVNMGTKLDFFELSHKFLNNTIYGEPNYNTPLDADTVWDYLFKTKPKPPNVYFGTGGQFLVSSVLLKQYPIEFYQRALNIHLVCPDAPWIFERIWNSIFQSQIVPPCKRYYTAGLAVGDTLISISMIKKFAESEKNFGIICFPNKKFFSEKDFLSLLENVPESSSNIMLDQIHHDSITHPYWLYATRRRGAWERFVDDLSYYSGIPEKYIWPTCPREDYFYNDYHVNIKSNYRVNFDRYILFNPVSVQSTTMEHHHPEWKNILIELCKTKLPVVAVSKEKLDLSFAPSAINITGQTKSVMDDMSLAEKATLVVTTANNMAVFANFNKLKHIVMQTHHFMWTSSLFFKWMAKEDYAQLKHTDSINDFRQKFRQLCEVNNLANEILQTCPTCGHLLP